MENTALTTDQSSDGSGSNTKILGHIGHGLHCLLAFGVSLARDLGALWTMLTLTALTIAVVGIAALCGSYDAMRLIEQVLVR